jgi:hypothetical protein
MKIARKGPPERCLVTANFGPKGLGARPKATRGLRWRPVRPLERLPVKAVGRCRELPRCMRPPCRTLPPQMRESGRTEVGERL